MVFTLSKDVNVRLRGRIVRSSDEGVAVDFESMDESAFFHLRNMVRYSSQDADRIDRELQVRPSTRTKKRIECAAHGEGICLGSDRAVGGLSALGRARGDAGRRPATGRCRAYRLGRR